VQVSRSIGDAYMKYAEYNREPIKPKFRISEPFISPILTPDPTLISREIQPNDSFLIFASDGLWEHLSNQEAVDVVHSHPHAVNSLLLIFFAFSFLFSPSSLLS
jgi:pyruvate dehydrogenase phosphatase